MEFLKNKNITYRKYITFHEKLDGSDSKFILNFYKEKIRFFYHENFILKKNLSIIEEANKKFQNKISLLENQLISVQNNSLLKSI